MNPNEHRRMDMTEPPLAYELRLGVTGHREITDPESIARAVDKLLEYINNSLVKPGTPSLEWVIISPLAKGADRLVVDSVLKRPNSRLEVITPFSIEQYQKDFVDPKDLAEFEKLLAKLPKSSPPMELNKNRVPNTESERNRGYFDAGKAVIDSCEILIAIWDGKKSGGHGGTSDMIDYALRFKRTVLWINSEHPEAEIKMILPSRHHRHFKDEVGISQYHTRRLPAQAKFLSPGFDQLTEFLGGRTVLGPTFQSVLQKTETGLREQATKAGLSPSHLYPILKNIMPYFVLSDQLALRYQKQHVGASKAILFLSATAVTIGVFQTLFFEEFNWLVLFETLAMVSAVICLIVNRRLRWHEKWLHDRYLAELLRIAMFSLATNHDPCLKLAESPNVMPFYIGPNNWLFSTVRRLVGRTREEIVDPVELEPVKNFVIEGWIKRQRDFHMNSAEIKENADLKSRRTVLVLFVITFALSILHLAGVGHTHEGPPILSLGHWFTFLAIALPAWAAAIHGVGKQLQYDKIARRSLQMVEILDQYQYRMNNAVSIDELRRAIQQATHVIGMENFEWWVLLSFEPPELAA